MLCRLSVTGHVLYGLHCVANSACMPGAVVGETACVTGAVKESARTGGGEKRPSGLRQFPGVLGLFEIPTVHHDFRKEKTNFRKKSWRETCSYGHSRYGVTRLSDARSTRRRRGVLGELLFEFGWLRRAKIAPAVAAFVRLFSFGKGRYG